MKRKKIGLFLFGVSLILFSAGLMSSMTGGIIGAKIINFSVFQILGFCFFIGSLILLMSRQSLDAIVIPTGGGKWNPESQMYSEDEERAKKGFSEGEKLKKEGYYVISGYKGEGIKEMQGGQSYSIYKFLRNHGVKPSKMIVEGKSHDTMENVLYTLKKLKEKEEKNGVERPWNIAFVSYKDHLKRYNDFETEAIKKGLVNKNDFEFHEIPTNENSEEKDYETSPMRKILHRYKLATIGKYKLKDGGIKYVNEKDPIIQVIKKSGGLLKKIFGK